jgi:hypothetical protein
MSEKTCKNVVSMWNRFCVVARVNVGFVDVDMIRYVFESISLWLLRLSIQVEVIITLLLSAIIIITTLLKKSDLRLCLLWAVLLSLAM